MLIGGLIPFEFLVVERSDGSLRIEYGPDEEDAPRKNVRCGLTFGEYRALVAHDALPRFFDALRQRGPAVAARMAEELWLRSLAEVKSFAEFVDTKAGLLGFPLVAPDPADRPARCADAIAVAIAFPTPIFPRHPRPVEVEIGLRKGSPTWRRHSLWRISRGRVLVRLPGVAWDEIRRDADRTREILARVAHAGGLGVMGDVERVIAMLFESGRVDAPLPRRYYAALEPGGSEVLAGDQDQPPPGWKELERERARALRSAWRRYGLQPWVISILADAAEVDVSGPE